MSKDGDKEKRQSILVIDAAADNLRATAELFRQAFDVSVAHNAAAAVTIIKRKRPNAVVIGIDGGGAWGMATFDVLTKMGASADIPVVFLARECPIGIEEDALKTTAADFITRKTGDEEIIALRLTRITGGKPAQKPQKRPKDVQSERTPASLKGKRLLVAEDADLNQTIISDMLEDLGLIIDFANDGKQAVDAFQKAPKDYSAIFMDVFMPVTDGWEATKRIRALKIPEAAGIPIIAMTAETDPNELSKCAECGMNGHLHKPMSYDDFVKALLKFCL